MKRILVHVVIPILILVAAISGGVRIAKMAGEPEQKDPAEAAPAVEVINASPKKMTMRVVATGSVVPARHVTLTSEVTGRITKLSSKLVPGTFFRKGEVIARIDQRDYKLAITQEKGRVNQTELELELEKGRAEIAKRELEVLGRNRDGESAVSELAKRTPHLQAAKQNTESARSGLSRAKLNLERTAVRAPFNAIVLDKRVDVGQVVGPSSPIATLMGADALWINLSVPVEKLPFIKIPGIGDPSGSRVTVVHRIGPNRSIQREGRIIRLQGKLDDRNRTATLLAQIDDPFTADPDDLPLLAGAYVESKIDCDEEVLGVELPRSALVEGDYVWVVDSQDRIEKRAVEIGWRNRNEVVIVGGIQNGDRVVSSPLSKPLSGMKVAPLTSSNTQLGAR